MKLEAVTVSVGYGDFLAQTVPWNRSLFERWIVVTTPEDHETREVCRKFHLECLTSEESTRAGADFAKGRLIEKGLRMLGSGGWRMHLDADVVLPSDASHCLEAAHLDPTCIYGCDRLMVKSWEQWQKLLSSGYLQCQHGWHHAITWPGGIEPGARWASPTDGWVPIGFLQLWHNDADEWHGVRSRPYPISHGNACRNDVQHAIQWDRRKRILLPEIIAIHLESESCATGANWNGRTSRRFGPPGVKKKIPGCS
jgi:hypothetical protein